MVGWIGSDQVEDLTQVFSGRSKGEGGLAILAEIWHEGHAYVLARNPNPGITRP